jgi:hypothetical protein
MDKDFPIWVNIDHIGGWPEHRGGASMLTVGDVGANPDSPDVIKLTLVRENGKEDCYRHFSPDTPDGSVATMKSKAAGCDNRMN